MSGMGAVATNVGELEALRRRRRAAGAGPRKVALPRPTPGQVIQFYPYYSAVRFQAEMSTALGVTTYSFPTAERRAFGYGIGDPLGAAGFAASAQATTLETNLLNRAQTNAGEQVMIHGISAYVTADSDPALASFLLERVSCSISLNGEQQLYRLGRVSFLPGGGGLTGGGYSSVIRPGQNDQQGHYSPINNGLPGRENYFPLPSPIRWSSAGRADSNLVLLAKIERALTFTATARAAAAGIEAWTPPTGIGEPGTFVDVVFRLQTKTVSARSVNG